LKPLSQSSGTVQLKADVQIKTAFLIEIVDFLALKLHHHQVAI